MDTALYKCQWLAMIRLHNTRSRAPLAHRTDPDPNLRPEVTYVKYPDHFQGYWNNYVTKCKRNLK